MVHSDPIRNVRFWLEIDSIQLAEFSEIAIGETTIGATEHCEETIMLVRKLLGLRKFSTITLKRGFTTDRRLFDWYKSIADGKTAAARKKVVIVLEDEAGTNKARFVVTEAWPSKYHPSDFNVKSNEVFIETLELTADGLDQSDGSEEGPH